MVFLYVQEEMKQEYCFCPKELQVPSLLPPVTYIGSLYSLEEKTRFSLDLRVSYEWQPRLIKVVLLLLSYSPGSYNMLFNLLNLFHFLKKMYSPRIPLPYSHHCWENSC